MDINTFITELNDRGINLNDEQIKQFDIYYQTLVEWNNKMNLTAITDKEEVYSKHFFDSITAAFYYDFNQNIHLCDVGAGAGFPSIPLKICFPNVKITIVDSLQKRITFLNHLAKQLQLDNVYFHHDRAELFGKNKSFRETFDLVMARAVARMSVLSELCLPLCQTNGTFLAMKGPNLKEELNDSKQALQLLGGELETVHTFQLPNDNGERNIALIKKVKTTPKKYPRKPGVPNKTPIVN